MTTWEAVIQGYGPIGFGLVAVVVLWVVIVRPELAAFREARRTEQAELERMMHTAREAANANRQSVEILARMIGSRQNA